jgi:hypothetical protein
MEYCLGMHRHRWEDEIELDLKELGYEIESWIHLAFYRN